MELYNISNLSYSYPGSDMNALSDISLKINKGEFVILCGSSGSGKSTLLNLMKAPADAGTQKGKISFSGHFAGFVTQFTDEQIVCDKVWHELAFGAESIGLSQNEIRSQVSQTALFFGIEDLLYCDCDKLSGGQKQMINLASVMAMNPDVLLLDEPLSQLDPIASTQFISLLVRINKELGTTVIVAEHQLGGLLSVVKRVVMLDNGKVCHDGDASSLTEHLSAMFFHCLTFPPLRTGIHPTAKITGSYHLPPQTIRCRRKAVYPLKICLSAIRTAKEIL